MIQPEYMTTLHIASNHYDDLRSHLFHSDVEEVAFLFCRHSDVLQGTTLTVVDLFKVPPSQFEIQSSFHVELAEDVRPSIIKAAWDRQLCLVEAHSHLTSSHAAQFSWSDLAGFREFVPHVLWRLPARPYAALVFTRTEFDALVWLPASKAPCPLNSMLIDSARELIPTNLSFLSLHSKEAYESRRPL